MPDPDTSATRRTANEVVAEWFDEHVATIHRYAARRVGEDQAGDVAAETFRIALERFEDFDGRQGGERPWLYGIASNILRRHWRTEQRRLSARAFAVGRERPPGDPLGAVDARLDAFGDLVRVLHAIELLAPSDRDLLFLVVWEGLTSAEVAEVMGVPAGTVRSRLNRIRGQLERHQGGQQ